jgi:hypothetical protein
MDHVFLRGHSPPKSGRPLPSAARIARDSFYRHRRPRSATVFEKLDIAFHGYDHDTRELFEIPEVREYVSLLDDQFPYWLFFMRKNGLGLQAITYCLMPPYLNKVGRETVLPERLNELLSNRWFPAMNHICVAVGFSEGQIETLTNKVVDYIFNGPTRK